MRTVMLVLVGWVVVLGQGLNWNGILDTAIIPGVFDTSTVRWTKGFPLSQYEDIRVVVKSRGDTTAAGWLGDSVSFEWGYQTFARCLDTTGSTRAPDTCFDLRIVLDTLDSLAMTRFSGKGTTASDGTITRNNRVADTAGCIGYITQSRWFPPEWDQYIRFWCRGVGKNVMATGKNSRVVFDVKRREYINVRMK